MTASANNGVDWTRTGDAEVRSRLHDELERLRECDAFAALGLTYDANDQQIRAAFLRITKTYHPNRFARREPEIFRLANEVFLLVNKAYSRISSSSLREQELERLDVNRYALRLLADRAAAAAEEEIEPAGPSPSEEVAEAPPPPEPAPAPKPKFRRVATTPGAVPSRIARAPGTNPSRIARAPGTNPSRIARAPGTNPSQIPKTPGTNPSQIPKAPGTNPSRFSKVPGTNPSQGPSEVDLRQATRAARRMRRAGGTPTPMFGTPITQRVDLTKEFRAAKAKLETGAYAAARAEFRQLAAQDPSNKELRVYMHYAGGREHHAAGRAEQARAEYNRALALDADFEPARAALESLDGPRPRGLLSKWFKK